MPVIWGLTNLTVGNRLLVRTTTSSAPAQSLLSDKGFATVGPGALPHQARSNRREATLRPIRRHPARDRVSLRHPLGQLTLEDHGGGPGRRLWQASLHCTALGLHGRPLAWRTGATRKSSLRPARAPSSPGPLKPNRTGGEDDLSLGRVALSAGDLAEGAGKTGQDERTCGDPARDNNGH